MNGRMLSRDGGKALAVLIGLVLATSALGRATAAGSQVGGLDRELASQLGELSDLTGSLEGFKGTDEELAAVVGEVSAILDWLLEHIDGIEKAAVAKVEEGESRSVARKVRKLESSARDARREAEGLDYDKSSPKLVVIALVEKLEQVGEDGGEVLAVFEPNGP